MFIGVNPQIGSLLPKGYDTYWQDTAIQCLNASIKEIVREICVALSHKWYEDIAAWSKANRFLLALAAEQCNRFYEAVFVMLDKMSIKLKVCSWSCFLSFVSYVGFLCLCLSSPPCSKSTRLILTDSSNVWVRHRTFRMPMCPVVVWTRSLV